MQQKPQGRTEEQNSWLCCGKQAATVALILTVLLQFGITSATADLPVRANVTLQQCNKPPMLQCPMKSSQKTSGSCLKESASSSSSAASAQGSSTVPKSPPSQGSQRNEQQLGQEQRVSDGASGSNEQREFSCKNENGADVDWFIVLKGARRNSQCDYLYITPQGQSISHKIVTVSDISRGPLPVAWTLMQAFDNNKRNMKSVVAYNDQFPSTPDYKKKLNHTKSGHMKGVIMTDAADPSQSLHGNGFWLIHSVPRFPDFSSDTYTFPTPERNDYGQSFICVNISKAQIPGICNQLAISVPWFYQPVPAKQRKGSHFVFDHMSHRENILRRLGCESNEKRNSQGQITDNGTDWNRLDIQINDWRFTHYAISPRSPESMELYSLVSENLSSAGLRVRCWQRTASNEELLAETETIKYVQSATFLPDKDRMVIDVNEDHSKWCVTTGEPKCVCVGDLNRMKTKSKRGGGLLCLCDVEPLWRLFYSATEVPGAVAMGQGREL